MFRGYSTYSDSVDSTFLFIFGISAFILLGITAFMIYCVIRFERKRNPNPVNIPGNLFLETVWTVVPTLIVLVMFQYGWDGYKKMRNVPSGAMEITAVGKKWQWEFRYATKNSDDFLYVPVNRPIKVNLRSQDVIHSFYIPSFRIKMDVLPGDSPRTYVWFEATTPGIYDIYCAEYCGDQHSGMLSKVVVMEQGEFDRWVSTAGSATGQTLFNNNCASCHSLDGSKIVGPTLKGIFNSQREVVVQGQPQTVKADEGYLEASIRTPALAIAKDFVNGAAMPVMPLKDQEIKMVIDFLKEKR